MKYKVNLDDVPLREVIGREVWDVVGGEKLKGEDMSMMVVDVLPGSVSKPGHLHTDCEEIIFVASGEGDILINEEVVPLRPGDTVLIPKDVAHLTRNLTKERLRLICFFSTTEVGDSVIPKPDLDFP